MPEQKHMPFALQHHNGCVNPNESQVGCLRAGMQSAGVVLTECSMASQQPELQAWHAFVDLYIPACQISCMLGTGGAMVYGLQ